MSRFLSSKKRHSQSRRQWHSKWSYDETLCTIKKLASWHAEQAGPEWKHIADSINSDNFHSLCNLDFEYVSGSDPEKIRHARQAAAYYSKLEPLKLSIDKKHEAIKTWLWAESECSKTNVLFQEYESGKLTFAHRNASIVLHNARRKISHVLGNVPTFEDLQFRFGPGATTLTKKREASIARKLATSLSCSSDLLPYASRILEELPHLCDLHNMSEDDDAYRLSLSITREVVRFVPKSAKTFRSISVMPSLNGLVQLALGDVIGRRLLSRAHIDITDQSINQDLARRGSIDGTLATIDLKSASDTLSIGLVSHLLPFDWLIALDSCRSEEVLLEGNVFKVDKYCSQGNGYTFPLQTLIFWAISSSVCDLYGEQGVSVYGDDIIVPSRCFAEVCDILSVFGFTPNRLKSFHSTSPFRESCGADFYRGINVRPKYLKDLLSYATLYEFHNFYHRNFMFQEEKMILDLIPVRLRLFGPDGYGDGILIGPYEPIRKKAHIRDGYGGHCFQSYRLKPRRETSRRYSDNITRVVCLYESYRSSYPPLLGREVLGGVSHGNSLLCEAPNQRFRKGVRDFDLPGSSGSEKTLIYTLGAR